jgi:hypothetical protein
VKRALLAVVIVVGCSPDTVPIGELNAQLARADCDQALRCHEYDTIDRCLASAPRGPITTSIEAAVAAGLVDYDGEQAAECVAQHEDISCSLVALSSRTEQSAICTGVLRAGRKLGDRCALDAECDSRNCGGADNCGTDVCCAGTCVEPHHLSGLHGSCAGISCAPDLWCDGEATCEPLLPIGSFCYDLGSCAYGLDCSDDMCVTSPNQGDPCLPRMLTGEAPWCGANPSLRCEPLSMTCQPALGVGATCDPVEPFGPCQVGWLRCDPDAHTCTPFPRVGEPCDFSVPCEAGAFCTFAGEGGPAICLPLVDDGSPCNGGGECASGACSTATQLCVEPAVCT